LEQFEVGIFQTSYKNEAAGISRIPVVPVRAEARLEQAVIQKEDAEKSEAESVKLQIVGTKTGPYAHFSKCESVLLLLDDDWINFTFTYYKTSFFGILP
jgi:hypothetical protein